MSRSSSRRKTSISIILTGPYHPRDEDLRDSGDHEQVLSRGVTRRRVKQSQLLNSDVKIPAGEDIPMVDRPHDGKSPVVEEIELVYGPQLTYVSFEHI